MAEVSKRVKVSYQSSSSEEYSEDDDENADGQPEVQSSAESEDEGGPEDNADSDIESSEENENASDIESGLEHEDGSDNDSDNDEDEVQAGEKQSGLANVMAKILGKQIADNRVILAKAKTDKEILKTRKLKEQQEESSDEDAPVVKKIKSQTEEKPADSVDEFDQKRELQLKRRKWENMNRVKPITLEREKERKLQRIATRGVVQLFNAVQKQQKTIKEKLAAVGSSVRKQDKVLESVDKGHFLDVLKGTKTKGKADSAPDTSKKDNPSWSILKDDFMMGAKMKDWDKASDSEENNDQGEEAMEQGNSSDDSDT